jgi:hypothetical protein
MRGLRFLPKPLLSALAVLFAIAAILYGWPWILYGSRGVPVELGFDNHDLTNQRCQFIENVRKQSPAERAGLRPGDCIVALDGAPIQRADGITRVWAQHRPGDHIDLTVKRPGISSLIVLHATFRSSQAGLAEAGILATVSAQIIRLYPIVFLTVGLAVLSLRIGFGSPFVSLPPQQQLLTPPERCSET